MSKIGKELKLLTTAELKKRYDEVKSQISELDKEITLIYIEYRKRESESEKVSNWMKEI